MAASESTTNHLLASPSPLSRHSSGPRKSERMSDSLPPFAMHVPRGQVDDAALQRSRAKAELRALECFCNALITQTDLGSEIRHGVDAGTIPYSVYEVWERGCPLTFLGMAVWKRDIMACFDGCERSDPLARRVDVSDKSAYGTYGVRLDIDNKMELADEWRRAGLERFAAAEPMLGCLGGHSSLESMPGSRDELMKTVRSIVNRQQPYESVCSVHVLSLIHI